MVTFTNKHNSTITLHLNPLHSMSFALFQQKLNDKDYVHKTITFSCSDVKLTMSQKRVDTPVENNCCSQLESKTQWPKHPPFVENLLTLSLAL